MEKVQNETLSHPVVIEEEMEFTPAYRWQHWIRALSILILTVTGFYIAEPFVAPISNGQPTNFMQAYFRFAHIVFGFMMTAVVFWKLYLTFFAKAYKHERRSLWDIINPAVWVKQIGYYLFMTKHPHLKGVYNPLQSMAYIGLYIVFFILILTGFILYANVYHDGFGGLIQAPMQALGEMMGGLAWVRELHHIAMWAVILVVFIHIYMASFNAIFGKNGSMDAIFSGMKWHKKH